MESQLSADDARRALGDISSVQHAASRRLRSPWWFWHAFALGLIAVAVLAFVMPRGIRGWASPVFLVALIGFGAWLKRRIPASAFDRNARAKRIGWVYIAGVLALIAGSGIAYARLDHWWPLAAAAVLTYGLTLWLGPLSERGVENPTRRLSP